MIEFKEWPKISRLSKESMVVTEKIDGTNACVVFLPLDGEAEGLEGFRTGAQSRSRLITVDSDNCGFAKWVDRYSRKLFADLGYGYHYGEWWGSGIQRGYGLEKGEKRFSLFNAPRWNQVLEGRGPFQTPQLGIVPLLYDGPANLAAAQDIATDLYKSGSQAQIGFDLPEGIVIYLREAKATYKVTDSVPGEKHL